MKISRTKRFYNYPNNVFRYWHPYHELCTGHCDSCHDPMVSKRRRLNYKKLLNYELRQLCPFNSSLNGGYCYNCWLQYDYYSKTECEYIIEV